MIAQTIVFIKHDEAWKCRTATRLSTWTR